MWSCDNNGGGVHVQHGSLVQKQHSVFALEVTECKFLLRHDNVAKLQWKRISKRNRETSYAS
jgi:hypothetical protein